MIFRTIIHMIRSRLASRLEIRDIGRVRLQVLPTDLDVLGHMNNGIYFSLMDLGRLDLLVRAGAWKKLSAVGYYPVMANETISFRKSLKPWQRFVLETRVIGVDDRAVYVEQRFTVDGEIHASAMTRGRFLKKSGGTVSVAELAELLGLDVSDLIPPRWVLAWADHVALPSTRQAAPSQWGESDIPS